MSNITGLSTYGTIEVHTIQLYFRSQLSTLRIFQLSQLQGLAQTPAHGTTPVTFTRRRLPSEVFHWLPATGARKHVPYPVPHDGEHLEAMARVARHEQDGRARLGYIINDEIRVAGVSEPAHGLPHERPVGESRKCLGQELANLALVMEGHEVAVGRPFRRMGNTRLGVRVDVAAAHGAQLEELRLGVRLEEEAEIARVCDGNSPESGRLGIGELNMRDGPGLGDDLLAALRN